MNATTYATRRPFAKNLGTGVILAALAFIPATAVPAYSQRVPSAIGVSSNALAIARQQQALLAQQLQRQALAARQRSVAPAVRPAPVVPQRQTRPTATTPRYTTSYGGLPARTSSLPRTIARPSTGRSASTGLPTRISNSRGSSTRVAAPQSTVRKATPRSNVSMASSLPTRIASNSKATAAPAATSKTNQALDAALLLLHQLQSKTTSRLPQKDQQTQANLLKQLLGPGANNSKTVAKLQDNLPSLVQSRVQAGSNTTNWMADLKRQMPELFQTGPGDLWLANQKLTNPQKFQFGGLYGGNVFLDKMAGYMDNYAKSLQQSGSLTAGPLHSLLNTDISGLSTKPIKNYTGIDLSGMNWDYLQKHQAQYEPFGL